MKVSGAWLEDPALQTLFALLADDGAEARVNGGAVRNAILGEPVADVDLSTPLLPAEVMSRLTGAGHKAVPTGIDHGTVTAVVDGQPFEVTTLRQDVETDGRRAVVSFTTDWREDALRRDLTMNALYCSADGEVFDPLGGLPDLEARNVRFIEDADTRIREDYLRILRFFRFFAWYGRFRPDADGLKACARLREGIDTLSAERVWAEFSKLLAAPDPMRALLWMRNTSVLRHVLPEGDLWGIDAMGPLVALEQAEGWAPDAMLRLMAIVPPDVARMKSLATRLKMPNRVRDRLIGWAEAMVPRLVLSGDELVQLLYRADLQAVADRIRLAMIEEATRDDLHGMLEKVEAYERPIFPLSGKDLIAQGMEPGPAVSERLKELEDRWVSGNFMATGDELLKS